MNRNVLIIKSVCLKVLSWSSLKKHLKTVLSITSRSVSPKLASSLTDMNTDTLAEHVLSLYLFCKSGASGSVTLCLYTKRIRLKGSTSLLTLQNPRRNICQHFKDSTLKQQRLSSRAQNAHPPSLSTFVDVMRSGDAIGSTDAMRSCMRRGPRKPTAPRMPGYKHMPKCVQMPKCSLKPRELWMLGVPWILQDQWILRELWMLWNPWMSQCVLYITLALYKI